MKIEYYIYELMAKAPIESKNVYAKREGALLKFIFDDGKVGYADCHPWVELKQVCLSEQLDLLKQNTFTDVTRRSLYYAKIDADARSKKINLLNGLTVPLSHFFIENLFKVDFKEIAKRVSEGFNCFKVKLGRNLSEEMPILLNLMSSFPEIKFRLDFNLKISISDFEGVLKALKHNSARIDFFEDPFKFDPQEWKLFQKQGLEFAIDYDSESGIVHPEAARVLVIKPAVQDDSHFSKTSQKLVYTTCLDHPLGQTAAAWSAAIASKDFKGPVALCGLLSHHTYHSNPFSEQLATSGPAFKAPVGTGFGFDRLLQQQPWKALCKL